MRPGLAKMAIILGVLCLAGPVSIDMYLPALPDIAADFGAEESAVQMTLMVFFLAFGVSQIVYGPLSDMYGRRPVILFGLGLFSLGSLGCFLSPSIGMLIFFRFLQGVGASAAMAIPRAIVRDMYTGTEATRLMAMVLLVISIGPMLAPLMGSFVIGPFGWRAVFLAVLCVGLIGAFLTWRVLPETHHPERRQSLSVRRTMGHFGRLLLDPSFMGLTLIAGFGMASFFAFLATAPFVYMEHFGLGKHLFAVAFAFNAVGFFAMSQMAARLGVRFGLIRTVKGAVTGYFAFSAILLALTLAGTDNFFVLAVLLFLTYACLGLVVPTAGVLALETNGPIAGSAAALGGTLQMVVGAIAIGVVSAFFDGTTLPMVTAVAVCATLAFIIGRFTLHLVQLAPESQANQPAATAPDASAAPGQPAE